MAVAPFTASEEMSKIRCPMADVGSGDGSAMMMGASWCEGVSLVVTRVDGQWLVDQVERGRP